MQVFIIFYHYLGALIGIHYLTAISLIGLQLAVYKYDKASTSKQKNIFSFFPDYLSILHILYILYITV